MSKYEPIRTYLTNSRNQNEILSYSELEIILGFTLPDSAYTHREWWANETIQSTRHTHCKEWIEAGWKVKNVNLGVNVIFEKIMI